VNNSILQNLIANRAAANRASDAAYNQLQIAEAALKQAEAEAEAAQTLAQFAQDQVAAEIARSAAAPVDATDWSHRAPLENWYEDYASDFEEN
jgi:hypothetical protein